MTDNETNNSNGNGNNNNYFITFGGPSESFHNAVSRICEEARAIHVFDHIIGYTEQHLMNDASFWEKHSEFITTHPIGYGHWLWKSYVTKLTLHSLHENDILVYADAGCTINPKGMQRLLEYFDIVNKSQYGILSFKTVHLEKTWTKMDTFEYYDANHDESIFETEQLVGGIYVIRKCQHTVDLVNKWYDGCCNYNLIDDSPSAIPNHTSFRENRHDQSIFSVIRKKYGTEMTEFDETYFDNSDWYGEGIRYPFWATRLK